MADLIFRLHTIKTRHSKNCTANSVYTYHERKTDSRRSGYGNQRSRLSKESIKQFDCCCLTLQPCQDPMVTKDGYLFDKAAILEYIVTQQQLIKQKRKLYDDELTKRENEKSKIVRLEQETKLHKFMNLGNFCHEESEPKEISTVSGNIHCWRPDDVKINYKKDLKIPSKVVKCPITGKPIKFRELIPVKFTPCNNAKDDARSLLNMSDEKSKYKCALTGDLLTNSSQICVLRPSGSVVTKICVEKFIRKDMIDPISNMKLVDGDIIELQRGSSGFAASGNFLVAEKSAPSMQV